MKFLERERSLRDSELERARKGLERTDAVRDALRLERELARRRQDAQAALSVGRQADQGTEGAISQLERRTLDAQKRQYELEKELADRGKKVTDDRLKLFEARERVIRTS